MKKLILDTDMLTDCDDAAAIAMLHTMCGYGEAELLAVAVSSRYPMSATVVDAVNTYYGRGDIPLGAPKNGRGAYRHDSCFLDAVAAEFPHKLMSNDDAPDAVELYRRVLAQAGAPVTIVTIGYLTNLADLLKSPADNISRLTGAELVADKVAEWVCMGGNFPVNDPEDSNVNFTRDGESAVFAIRNWPGIITFAGREIGHNIYIGDRLKETPEANPVKRAYRLHRERVNTHWNHHTADPCAVLYAVRGAAEYFDIQEGYMHLNDDCSFTWEEKRGSCQRRLIQKMDRELMGGIMEELMITPPLKSKGE